MYMKIPILMYHSIGSPPKKTKMKGLFVSKRSFFLQLLLMKTLGYQGLSIHQLMPYLQGNKSGRVFGITFDDGYQNNLLYAAPILNFFRFTATCYVVAGSIGKSNSWDHQLGIIDNPVMSAHEIQKWINLGNEVGSHTLTHKRLDSLSQDILTMEIVGSKKLLDEKFNINVQAFCYPYGAYDNNASLVVQQTYSSATTTARSLATTSTDLFHIPRVLVSWRTNIFQFVLKIFTDYESIRHKKRLQNK